MKCWNHLFICQISIICGSWIMCEEIREKILANFRSISGTCTHIGSWYDSSCTWSPSWRVSRHTTGHSLFLSLLPSIFFIFTRLILISEVILIPIFILFSASTWLVHKIDHLHTNDILNICSYTHIFYWIILIFYICRYWYYA